MTAFTVELPALTELGPAVTRVLAPNPSMMTGPGTNTYLIGTATVAVIDPGPLIDDHIDAIEAAARGPIRAVLVTHTHPDHSPAACELARRCGAELLGRPPPAGAHQDTSFRPDRVLGDGDTLAIDGEIIEAVETPGHASNHLCYRLRGPDWLFTGDHVIAGSTVVIDPPDGSMSAYLASLRKVRDLACAALAPGHGDLILDPNAAIDWIIEHRLEREAKVLAALRQNPGSTAMMLVPSVYRDVDTKLYGWAERSLLAHLGKLQDDGLAENRGGRWEPRHH